MASIFYIATLICFLLPTQSYMSGGAECKYTSVIVTRILVDWMNPSCVWLYAVFIDAKLLNV